jgi:methyl-accepting chemotaxis protein
MARYDKTRFWALWDGNDLVAVVVYKKGAAELLRRLAAQAPAATEAAAQAAAMEAAVRQAKELATQARALARQARTLAQAARAQFGC